MRRRATIRVRIRAGTEADVDEFIRISYAIWRHSIARVLDVAVDRWPAIAGVMRAELLPIARRILVATQGPVIVGYSYREGATIEDLWVDPPFQNAGIGPQLLHAQIAAIAAEGYRTASLECLEMNVHARRFYEREGWRLVYRYSRGSQMFRYDIPRLRFEYDVWRRRRR